MDAARTRGLIRDEQRLRAVLNEYEGSQFDADSSQAITDRVSGLLETVLTIAEDDDFWDRLGQKGRLATPEQLQRVERINLPVFAMLLTAAGYQSPPPPPADELVRETMNSVTAALEDSLYRGRTGFPDVRWQLWTMHMRVSRQIYEFSGQRDRVPALQRSARWVQQAVRWFIPRALAATAGGIVEKYVPGSGLEQFPRAVLKRTAEDLMELGASVMAGYPTVVPEAELHWHPIDELRQKRTASPESVHLAWLAQSVIEANSWRSDETDSASEARGVYGELARRELATAHRHLDRLAELLQDGGDGRAEIKVAAIRKSLEEFSVTADATGRERVINKILAQANDLRPADDDRGPRRLSAATPDEFGGFS